MGYIYLMPFFNKRRKNEKKLLKNKKKLELKNINAVEKRLYNMVVENMIYKKARGNLFMEEYINDLDEQGYLKGIELSLTKDRLFDMIENIKLYNINWNDDNFTLLLLDKEKIVFNKNNIIYPMTEKKDSFAIVSINEEFNSEKTGYIKGYFTRRYDLYPENFLQELEYIINNNSKIIGIFRED